MRARTIDFTHEVRTGPSHMDRKQKLRLDDQGFGPDASGNPCGTIEVDLKQRFVRIWNPRCDKVTGEPVVTELPLERVIQWEPLTPRQEAIFYPPPEKKTEAA